MECSDEVWAGYPHPPHATAGPSAKVGERASGLGQGAASNHGDSQVHGSIEEGGNPQWPLVSLAEKAHNLACLEWCRNLSHPEALGPQHTSSTSYVVPLQRTCRDATWREDHPSAGRQELIRNGSVDSPPTYSVRGFTSVSPLSYCPTTSVTFPALFFRNCSRK